MIELLFGAALEPCPHDGRPAQTVRDAHDRFTVKCPRCSFAVSDFEEKRAGEKWNERVTQTRKFLAAESAADNKFAYLRHRADVRKCCANPDNLVVAQERADLLVATCGKCGARHRKLRCAPGAFSLALRAS